MILASALHISNSCASAALPAAAAALSHAVRALSSAAAPQRPSSSSQLQVQVEPLSAPYEGISVVSLVRPEAKNAIGAQLLRELQEALATLRQERTTRAVLLRSLVPGCFSAGADLKVGHGSCSSRGHSMAASPCMGYRAPLMQMCGCAWQSIRPGCNQTGGHSPLPVRRCGLLL
jgi:hypothetical protein